VRAALVLFFAVLACSPKQATTLIPQLAQDGSVPDGGAGCACGGAWGDVVDAGLLGEPALVELSGLVASRAHPGVLYAHNDSGDTARFFALDEHAQALGEFDLTGASASDWEDIGLGPCPTGTCVYLGDIGDNRRIRTDYAVYRVAEPQVEVGAPAGVVAISAWDRLPYTYPGDEKNNCESLFVHPVSGRVYLVTKETNGVPSRVFRFPEPLTPGVSATLELVATLPFPTTSDAPLTAADVNPCGTAVLLRMYNRLVELRLPAGAPFEDVFARPPITVPVADEPQGEAVAYRADGLGYFTSSEVVSGPVGLSAVRCR
jgi:hypothetical protein